MEQIALLNLSPELKLAYLETLLPIIMADKEVSVKELRRIYQLFAIMDLSSEDRMKVLSELFFEKLPLSDKFSVNSDLVADENLKISLAKDAMVIDEIEKDKETSRIVNHLVQVLGISQKKIEFLKDWVAWENKIMEKIGRGDLKISRDDMPSELISRAAALGIPLAALYFSGSVIGFSAAGITSGLAAIGLKSGIVALGFNPMTAGIVALIMMGISIHTITKVLTSSKIKKKEVANALREAERIRRLYIQQLSDDIAKFQKAKWWEFFTIKRRKRLEAIKVMGLLLEADVRIRGEDAIVVS